MRGILRSQFLAPLVFSREPERNHRYEAAQNPQQVADASFTTRWTSGGPPCRRAALSSLDVRVGGRVNLHGHRTRRAYLLVTPQAAFPTPVPGNTRPAHPPIYARAPPVPRPLRFPAARRVVAVARLLLNTPCLRPRHLGTLSGGSLMRHSTPRARAMAAARGVRITPYMPCSR